MAENYEAPEAGQLSSVWTRGRRVAKERTAQRVCSWTVQNEMRGVLRRVSAGAAGRIVIIKWGSATFANLGTGIGFLDAKKNKN